MKVLESQIPSSETEDASTSASASRYDTVVLTALPIRRLTGKRGKELFKPREIPDSVPPPAITFFASSPAG